MPAPNSNYGVDLQHRLAQSIARQQQLIDLIFEGIRVCLVGVVKHFDAAAQTVDVIVATNEYETDNPSNTTFSPETDAAQLPLLQGVPVAVLSAGGFSVTLPIAIGDECLLIFNDVALDVWWQNSGPDKTNLDSSINHNPISQRRHNLSDAIAVFGIRPRARAVSGYSTSSLQIRNEDNSVQIELTPTTINIVNQNGQVNVEGQSDINVTGQANVNVTGQSDVKVSGQASVHVSGGPSRQTFIDGKPYWMHTHGGVQTGLGVSGPPVYP